MRPKYIRIRIHNTAFKFLIRSMFRIQNIWILGFVGHTYKTEANSLEVHVAEISIRDIGNGPLPSKDFRAIFLRPRRT
jgi:hypothetical protein